jgi:hypothetical protein
MSKSDYSYIDRVVHKFALQGNAIAEISFDLENSMVNKRGRAFAENHVFVSGLARSGTTILMEYLYATGYFTSLTYLNMPFVLMPNLWKRISSKKVTAEPKERAHKDGIFVNFDSPEALEEVFWRTFCGKKYIFDDRLKIHDVKAGVLQKFKDYLNNIIASSESPKQGRYLSKNNNSVLRLHSLQKGMPLSHFIIPFRKPLQHASSLLNQHVHFSQVQTEDKFSLDYMNWLSHFEFGLNQKSFFLNDEATFNEMAKYANSDINFWLLNWKNYYQYILNQSSDNTTFFNYEAFCEQPVSTMTKLFKMLDIEAPEPKLESFKMRILQFDKVNKSLLNDCEEIYNELNKLYINKFNS